MDKKTLFVLGALAAAGTLMLFGCGGNGEGRDPYAQVTLQEVTRGPVVASKGFRYKLVAPEILEKSGHLCLVREGDIEELIVGRNIAERLAGLDPNDIQFNVVKKFTPYVHFQCEQIVSGEDTVFISQAAGVDLPKIVPTSEYAPRDFEEFDLERLLWERTDLLLASKNKKYMITGKVRRETSDGEEQWILSSPRAKVRVVNVPNAVEIVLKRLEATNAEFQGGITFTEVEPIARRQTNRICGNIEVDFVRYTDKYVLKF
jgi:hypothetical protein